MGLNLRRGVSLIGDDGTADWLEAFELIKRPMSFRAVPLGVSDSSR